MSTNTTLRRSATGRPTRSRLRPAARVRRAGQTARTVIRSGRPTEHWHVDATGHLVCTWTV
jgi:hypothetical protein